MALRSQEISKKRLLAGEGGGPPGSCEAVFLRSGGVAGASEGPGRVGTAVCGGRARFGPGRASVARRDWTGGSRLWPGCTPSGPPSRRSAAALRWDPQAWPAGGCAALELRGLPIPHSRARGLCPSAGVGGPAATVGHGLPRGVDRRSAGPRAVRAASIRPRRSGHSAPTAAARPAHAILPRWHFRIPGARRRAAAGPSRRCCWSR